jgi:hypothetical protein
MWFLLAVILLADDLSSEAAFAQLDRLDSLDTSHLQFVKVATGNWIQYGSDPPQNRYRFGFLVDTQVDCFTVRYLDLTRETLRPTLDGTAEHTRIGYTSQDMAELARDLAKRIAPREQREPDLDYYMGPDAPMDPRGEALLLARACLRRGLQSESEGLISALGSVAEAYDEVGSGCFHALSMDFADAALTRDQLLERHRKWKEAFSKHSWAANVDSRIEILTRMIAEDRTRRSNPGEIEPSPDDVATLLFQLRNEFRPVEKWYVDGWFVPPTGSTPSDESRPSLRLQRLGFQAVPELLAAIGDESPTRCVWYSPRFGGSFRILDVGTFAEELLQQIAGVRFYGKTGERKAAWQSWWTMVSQKGEEGALAELASRGDESSADAAKRLLARWPHRVGDILIGIRRADNRGDRAELVNVVSENQDEPVTTFLLEELRTGPYISARVDAARALLQRGRRDGLEFFKAEWQHADTLKERAAPDVPEAVADFDLAIAQGQACEAMADLLLSSGEREAVTLVGRDLMKRGPAVRDAVLDSLRATSLTELTERADAAVKVDVENAVEDILAQLLDDLRVRLGYYGFSHGDNHASLTNPRTADLAACTLAEFWPNRYHFDPVGPARLKDRRIAVLRNHWRERRGLAALPVAAVPDMRSQDPEVRATLERVIGAANADDRRRELVRLEASGLGALAWIEERLPQLPEGHAAVVDLKTLASTLANTVAEVQFDVGDWEAPLALRSSVTELKGKPLTSNAAIGLLLRAVEALPQRSGDVLLSADRLGDATGVNVQLRAAPATGERGVSVNADLSVVADGQTLAGSHGSGVRAAYDKPDCYEDVVMAIDKALALPNDKAFEIRLVLQLR